MNREEAKHKLIQMMGVGKAIQVFTDKIHLAQQFIEIQPLYYDRGRIWWFWNEEEFKWEMMDETDILNAMNKFSIVNTTKSQEKSEIVEALRQVGRLNKPKEIKSSWIQFKDQIYDLETGEKFDATPEYFVTNPIPFHLSGNPETPSFDKIFEEWVGKEYVETLHEILAYCLIPDYPLHRIFCLIGEGMNGKSCFLTILKKLIGEENSCSTELDTLLTSRFELTKLHKKLACIMGETNFNELSKTSILKKLSGGDLIGFEYKNKTPFDDVNYAKIIIATNNLPSTTDKTLGFYRRWMIIDFPNKFNESKNILDEIPDSEFQNLATNCFLTLKKLLANRQFTNEGTVEERKERFESKSDFLGKFLELHTEESFEGYITVRDFYNKFMSWCKENRHRHTSESSVGRQMKKNAIPQSAKYFDWMHDGKGGQVRCWMGIKWKDE